MYACIDASIVGSVATTYRNDLRTSVGIGQDASMYGSVATTYIDVRTSVCFGREASTAASTRASPPAPSLRT